MSVYSDLEDSLGAVSAWPLSDVSNPYVDRVAARNLTVASGSATPQNATLANGIPTVSLNGTLVATGALTSLTAFTMVAWVRIAGNQTSGLPLYIGNTGSNGAGLFISAHHSGGAGAEFQGLYGAVGFVDSAPTTLSFNTIYMLAIRRTAGTATLFVNGVSVGTGAATPGVPSNTSTMALVGDLGWVSVYPTGLADADIAQLFTVGSDVQTSTLGLDWVGQDAFLPVLGDPLALRWVGQLASLPILPPSFPATGKHAVAGSPALIVNWEVNETD